MIADVRSHALSLRLKGKSYNEIQKEVKVAKSTLSLWLRDTVLSDSARKRLNDRVRQGVLNGLIKRNRKQTHEAQKRARINQSAGRKQIPLTLNSKDLLLIGTILYWAEGHKRSLIRNGKPITSHPISFVNADPVMIRAFIQFLIKTLKISRERISFYMRLYPHINEQHALNHWMSLTGFSRESFKKSTFLISISSKRQKPFNQLPYGTLQVYVADTPKFHTLTGFIEGMKERF